MSAAPLRVYVALAFDLYDRRVVAASVYLTADAMLTACQRYIDEYKRPRYEVCHLQPIDLEGRL